MSFQTTLNIIWFHIKRLEIVSEDLSVCGCISDKSLKLLKELQDSLEEDYNKLDKIKDFE